MTAQEIIKSFMRQLAKHGFSETTVSGEKMMDAAIRASSRYNGIQEVIDAMKSDQIKAEKQAVKEILGTSKLISEIDTKILTTKATEYNELYKKSNMYIGEQYEYSNYSTTVEDVIKERKAEIFLKNYCGIHIYKKFWFRKGIATAWDIESGLTGNIDTGAITGSDAGGTEIKTAKSIVPENYVNTYVATTTTAQNIISNDRNWVVEATNSDDTLTANGSDSINACAGNDKIKVNESGATITSGAGKDKITVSAAVNDITFTDLNSDDTLTLKGTFEIGSAHMEDNLLVISDKTGKRKIKIGDLAKAKTANINGKTIGKWLADANINVDKIKSENYADGKVKENANVSEKIITVNLEEVDTSGACKVSVEGIEVGNLSSTFPDAETFTRRGLTIHLLGTTNDTAGGTNNIEKKTLEELSDDQRTIIAGLFKWWVDAGLKLGEESYDLGFNSETAMVKDMGLYFYDSGGNDNTLAAALYWPRNADGATTQLMLKINMNYFKGISADNMDGESTATTVNVLDRTLAHELTHSIMETNINYFNKLPQFIVEGIAELTHGIDDERGNRIFAIASDNDRLDSVLDVTNTNTGDADFYAGGYMFMRYFAKKAAESTLPAYGEITASVNPDKSGDYYISGEKSSETATTTAQAIKLGSVANGVYTVENTGVHQVIRNAKNLKILGLTVNDTLIGGDRADIVETAEGSYLTTGDGADSIKVIGQFATIEAGTGNDTINVEDGGHHNISLGAGNDYVKIKREDSYDNTVTSGGGNDTIEGFNETSTLIVKGGYTTIKGGSDIIVKADDGNILLKGAAKLESVNIEGESMIITGTSGADKIKNTLDGATIQALAGNDTINNTGDNVSIYGGAGKDTFIYTSGRSLIADYDKKDRISVGSAYEDYSISGSDLVFDFGENNTLTIANGAGKEININSSANIYTAEGVIDKKKKSIVLNAATKNFDAAKYSKLVTIDGSAAGEVNIIGNKKKNNIIAGAGGSTLAGGKGKDTINGGEAADIFLYGKGDGKDIIENYGVGDAISLSGNVTIKSFAMKKKDGVLKIGSGSITVKDTSEFRFIEGGAEKIFIDGNIADTDKVNVTLSSSYKGVFKANGYEKVDGTFTKKAVTLSGDDADNYLIGGAGKNSINGGAGADTLWGGKGNDTLYGGEAADTFLFCAGDGTDIIADYESGDMLRILNRRGDKYSTFKRATFKDGTLTLSIASGGKVLFSNVSDTTVFNINGDSYHVSDKTLTK